MSTNSGINVEMTSTVEAEPGPSQYLHAHDVRAWISAIPDGATLSAIMRDYGSQRDPVPTLVGLRAEWSEVRHEGDKP